MINHYILLVFCPYLGVIESILYKVLEEEELGVVARKAELGVFVDQNNHFHEKRSQYVTRHSYLLLRLLRTGFAATSAAAFLTCFFFMANQI